MCETEVDPETGAIEIRRYTSIDDGGQPINPLILHGQVHGGVAQGLGQAMLEASVYEPGSGQLLSASFLDYGMPRADHFPHLDVELTEDPTKGNALRVKGGGEAGITPSSAALMNAVIDALFGLGIEHSRGQVVAVDARSGRVLWRTPTVPGPGEPGHETWPPRSEIWRSGGGNPWAAGAADPALGQKLLGRAAPILEYPCWAAPIVSHGLLYLRGKDRLICLELIPQNVTLSR